VSHKKAAEHQNLLPKKCATKTPNIAMPITTYEAAKKYQATSSPELHKNR